MDILRRGDDNSNESMPLLPPKQREAAAVEPHHEQQPAAGGGRGGVERHDRRYRRVQWEALPRLASLVAVGVVVAITVAAAIVSFASQGGSSNGSSSSSSRLSALYPTKQAPTSLVGGNTAAAVSHGEAGSTISTPPSSLGNDVNKDGKGSSTNRGGGGGGDGDGDDGGGGIKQKKSEQAEEEEDEEDRRPPNVIFILIDDVGMNDMGPTSTDLSVVSPFMDSLAEGGVRLSRYYTNHICSPARSSIMSGRDTFRTGMQFEELQASQPWGLPLDEVTLAERFKSAGYATHMVGKWNLGLFAEGYYPFNRGFDTFLGYMGAGESYYSHERNHTFYYEGGTTMVFNDFGFGDKDGYIDYTTNTTRQGPELKGVYSTSLTADRAIEIANEHQAANEASGADDPLFMYLAFQAAHCPLDVPQEELFTDEQLKTLALITSEEWMRVQFAKIVYFLDIMIERIIHELDGMGMMDNTLVVVASDNGGCPAVGGSNYPYRGFKHTLFEGGVRTHAMVYSKSESIIPLEARGTVYDGMMHAVDWTPTLANVTGIPTGEMGKPLSGYDQWSAILGDRPESSPPVRNAVVLGRNSYVFDDDTDTMVETPEPRGAYIYDGWKINVGDKCVGWFSFNPIDDMLADPQCHVGECPTCSDGCRYENSPRNSFLFHIETDPYEKYNLLETMPDKFEEMVQRWDEACVDEVAPNFVSDDPLAVEMWEKFNNWTVAWK